MPYDDNGHGSFVAGVVAGNGMMSGQRVIAPAYHVNIVSIKAIDSGGAASMQDIIRAINYIIENARRYNIRVVIMSFGTTRDATSDSVLYRAIDILNSLGIIIVTASGNDGGRIIHAPASSNNVISVGSIDDELNISHFTTRGVVNGKMKPDYYALGENVIGIDRRDYTIMSGTSVATPYVASLVALIKTEKQDADLDFVKKILDKIAIHRDNIAIL